MPIRDAIEKRAREKAVPVSIRFLKGGLHVNTDAEAAQYHPARAERAEGNIRAQIRKATSLVDVSKLSPAEQMAHTRTLCIWGAKISALSKTARSISRAEKQAAIAAGEQKVITSETTE
jgi:hypothetical protein